MNITNIQSYKVLSFKGYDAIPLKALHIANHMGKIEEELQDIADKENFSLKKSQYNQSFNQDFKVILENKGKPKLIMKDNIAIMNGYQSEIDSHYGMKSELYGISDQSKGFISGGNFFLGKKPSGEKWMLIGASEQFFLPNKKQIAELYNVKEENIHFIQQQDYHLDLSVRPIGFPFVLINNPELSLRNEQKVKGRKTHKNGFMNKQDPQILAYKKAFEQLKQAGFYPIPIGGVYGLDVNFINAIVNKHPDGSISYITNSSKCDNVFVSKYQRQFEKDLKRKLDEIRKTNSNAPTIKSLYFVQGQNYGQQNEIMENLVEGPGGIHCMCLEEPDFDVWI